MKKIIIIGAGGHGQVVADALKLMDDAEPVAFLDDNTALHGKMIMGIPVVGNNSSVHEIEHDGIVVAVGNNNIRKKIFADLINAGEILFSVIHPRAVISPSVKIGSGCMILGGAVINTGAEIGDDTILNTNCTIEHHNKIGAHVHIAPGATLGGEVRIGSEAMVGIGATVLPRLTIEDRALLGAGSTAFQDIPENCVSVGIPARCIKKNNVKP